MGDRAQVLIKDTGVYLYTHWGGSKLPEVVTNAIRRLERWNDPEYLARIIFCEMIKDDVGGETGYGIGTAQHGDIWRVVEVDCEAGVVRVIDNDAVIMATPFSEI